MAALSRAQRSRGGGGGGKEGGGGGWGGGGGGVGGGGQAVPPWGRGAPAGDGFAVGPERFGQRVVVVGHLVAIRDTAPATGGPAVGEGVAGAKGVVEVAEDRVGGDQPGDRVGAQFGVVEELGEPGGQGFGVLVHAASPLRAARWASQAR
jgi:hypothetical protein